MQLTSFLERHFPDIILLQESNASESPLPFLKSQYSFYFNPPSQIYTGTIIGVRMSAFIEFHSHTILVPGHLQVLTISFSSSNRLLKIFSIYLPHHFEKASNILDALETHLEEISDETQIVIGGDFNITLNPNLDRSGNPVERFPRLALSLRRIINIHDLSDVWRDFNPTEPGFTFVGNAPSFSASRIDRFYVSPLISSSASSTRVIPSFSDHLAIQLSFKIAGFQAFPPYWRFDNALLADPNYTTCMHELFAYFNAMQDSYESLSDWWDALKQEIQVSSHAFIHLRKQIADEVFNRLERCVDEIVSDPQISRNQLSDLTRANTEVRDAYSRKSEIILSNANHDHLLATDRPAGTLLARDVAAAYKPLTQLRFEGRVVSDGPSLCTASRRHFLEVYSATPATIELDSPLYDSLPLLSHSDRLQIDAPLTELELSRALHSLNKGKSPGIDGLTPEFYIFFWNRLSPLYCAVFREALENGALPKSAQKSVLTLLPKKGDRLDINNWRPISLLTTDYKILAKALANRLRNVLGSIVHPDQGFCIPGRTIIDNLHLHRDILDYVNKNRFPLAILSLDQQAAFDRVEHNYLFHTLSMFGFGDNFINYLKTLYYNATCFVRVGSYLTAPFAFGRGIRQGCPLSGQLFSLSIEPFLRLCCTRLAGITLPCNEERKLIVSAYADDISVFVTNEDDFDRFHAVYTMYSTQSGAKLNTHKSTGLWAGSWVERDDVPLGFQWSSEGAKFLGIILGNNPMITTRNLDKLTTTVTDGINRWRHRASAMSLRGRVLIVNQFIAPRLWYILQIIPPPPALVTRLQGQLANFVWAGRRHWTRLRDLCAPIHLGGLGLIHIQSKLALFRILFAHRFINALENHPCHDMTRYFLRKFRGLGLGWQVFFCPRISGPDTRQTTDFLQTVLRAWASLNPRPSSLAKTVCGLREIPLTLSSLIPSSTSPFIPSWMKLEYNFIGDLLEGSEWKNLHTVPGFIGLSTRHKKALEINYRQIQAYCHLRFRGVRETEGPDLWPPSLTYYQHRQKKFVPFEPHLNRRTLQFDIMSQNLDLTVELKGSWSADRVNWSAMFRSPSLGLDAEVSWRFAKNRLADPVFLYHAGLSPTSLCPWCQVEGTAWHMIAACQRATPMWHLVNNIIRALFGQQRSLLLEDVCVGFSSATATITKVNLANYVIVLAKSTCYRLLTAYFKEDRVPSPYDVVLKARIRSRIMREYAWYLGRGAFTSFSEKWCAGEALCSLRDNELIFGPTLTSG